MIAIIPIIQILFAFSTMKFDVDECFRNNMIIEYLLSIIARNAKHVLERIKFRNGYFITDK